MALVTLTDVHKSFGPQTILGGACLSIQRGERVGLVGLNGSGKSTIAKICAGLETPDLGTISCASGALIAYLAQEPTLDPNRCVLDVARDGLVALAGAEARYSGAQAKLASHPEQAEKWLQIQESAASDIERLGGWNIDHLVLAMLSHLGLSSPQAIIGDLSGGERRRVALAQILLAKPDLAILDEPTNHLDAETIEWLEQYLAGDCKSALLLITHDRYVLDRVVNRTVEIDQACLFSYEGGYEEYIEAKAERRALQARTESNRQNFLRTELEWLSRMPKARSTKQKARIDRALDAIAAVPVAQAKTTAFSFSSLQTGKTILELHDVGLAMGDKTLVKGLSLIVGKGERIGVVGRNGCGKTTLLRAISGEVDVVSGQIVVGANTKISYFDQTRSQLDLDTSVFANVAGTSRTVLVGDRPVDATAYLGRFLFDASKQRQPVGSLSGGERARVALAKMLLQPANLVLLDEPTNDLDLHTLCALEQMLIEMQASAIVVTHDRWFLDRVATSILAWEGPACAVRYQGNYETYRRIRPASAAGAGQPSPPRPSKPPIRVEQTFKAPRALTYSERLELEGILERIDAAEARVARLQVELGDPLLYAERIDSVAGLKEQLNKAAGESAKLLARWEELENKRAGR